MDSEQDALRLEQLRKDTLANVPGADKELFMILTEDLLRFFRSADADELTQITLMQVWAALPHFEPTDAMSFRNWVRVIASRVAKRWRKPTGRVLWLPDMAEFEVVGSSPSAWTLQRERASWLARLIAKFSSRLARAIAHRVSGRKAKDFAEAEDVPLGTAHRWLAQALHRLQNAVKATRKTAPGATPTPM